MKMKPSYFVLFTYLQAFHFVCICVEQLHVFTHMSVRGNLKYIVTLFTGTLALKLKVVIKPRPSVQALKGKSPFHSDEVEYFLTLTCKALMW